MDDILEPLPEWIFQWSKCSFRGRWAPLCSPVIWTLLSGGCWHTLGTLSKSVSQTKPCLDLHFNLCLFHKIEWGCREFVMRVLRRTSSAVLQHFHFTIMWINTHELRLDHQAPDQDKTHAIDCWVFFFYIILCPARSLGSLSAGFKSPSGTFLMLPHIKVAPHCLVL